MNRYLLTGLIEKMGHGEYTPLKLIKKAHKYKRFEKYAVMAGPLSICSRSNCTADGPGRIKIGEGCQIYGALQSMANGKIKIGNHTVIFERSIVGSVNRISIGNNVVISNQVHIYDNNNHPTSPRIRKEMTDKGFQGDAWRWTHAESAPIVIEDNVWIGENVTILKGVRIGKGSVIACGSVVTKDVPPYRIAAGNPAKVVKELEND